MERNRGVTDRAQTGNSEGSIGHLQLGEDLLDALAIQNLTHKIVDCLLCCPAGPPVLVFRPVLGAWRDRDCHETPVAEGHDMDPKLGGGATPTSMMDEQVYSRRP